MVSSNIIENCPILTSDVSNARAIFGPDLPSLRGKTVRRTPAPVVAEYVSVPRSLVETNRIITLGADVFFRGWDTFSAHGGMASEIRNSGARAGEDCDEPEQAHDPSAGGVQKSRVHSMNYFNGRRI